MDTGASSHMTNQSGTLLYSFHKGNFNSVIVGNDMRIPSTGLGDTTIPTTNRPLHLSNILVTPVIVKNLVFVRQFTIDNNVTVTFDPFGFNVNDATTGVRCDSSGELYPITPTTFPAHQTHRPSPQPSPIALSAESSTLWHARLGHPGQPVLEYVRCIYIARKKPSPSCVMPTN